MEPEEKVNNLSFNHDKGCFIVALDSGVRLYTVEPLTEQFNKSSSQIGSIKNAEMMRSTNVIALIGGGSFPKYADNVLLLYECCQAKFFCEITCDNPILGVRMELDRLVVAERNKIFVFTFPNDIKMIFSCNTRDNPLGICELAHGSQDRCILAFPSPKCGSVQILDVSTLESNASQAPLIIEAHESEIACLSINEEATLLATASTKGTLIRVWDAIKRSKLIELRRGSDPATLYCINFSGDSEFLCCSSDKGTVHIFALKDPKLNKRSTLSQMGIPGGYVESQWALANFTVPPERACICAFGAKSTVYAVCVDGSFHKYVFTSDGNCNRESFDIFLDVSDYDFF